jgi:hypothetical protein
MEARILAAVFASIMALAVGINGGSLNQADVEDIDAQHKNLLEGIFPESVDIFSMLSNRAEPTKTVTVNITAPGEETINLTDASFSAENLTSYSSESFSISSDSEVTLTGFSGEIVFDNTTEVSGRATGYLSSGVNSSRSFDFEKELDTKRVSITDAERVKISFSKVSGTVESDSSTSTINSSNLEIDSFSGNITAYPEEDRYMFEGKINELKAGGLTVRAPEEEN